MAAASPAVSVAAAASAVSAAESAVAAASGSAAAHTVAVVRGSCAGNLLGAWTAGTGQGEGIAVEGRGRLSRDGRYKKK